MTYEKVTMTHEGVEAGDSALERLNNLEQWREDASVVTHSSPVLNLHGLAADRVEQIKAIALALYDAEIAGARARVHFLGVAAA
jgi:hypothetical protein